MPNLIITSSEIKSAKISRAKTFSDMVLYEITILIAAPSSNKLYEYTNQNTKNRVAIAIEDSIFSISRILSPVSDKIILGGFDEDIGKLKALLSKITNNITIDINKE